MALRDNFPPAGTDYVGGESDGFIYRSIFGGATLQVSYEMIQQFLIEEGFQDLPLPKNVEELKRFKLSTRNHQILLFEDNGYVHNPIKILFPTDRRQKKNLILEVYNEKAPKHILRFHGKLTEQELAELRELQNAVVNSEEI